jgi:dynein heavy chain
MEVTGTVFEYNPKTLNLEAIFNMRLARFTEQIEEIVNEAVQEMKIAIEIGKVSSRWQKVELLMEAYFKDGKDRGFLLVPQDDLKLELEDTLLNLQTIAGSRFIGEFVRDVSYWDKTLNLVMECLDMWSTVQRKWQYLESIFIGAEDIRLQLPDEAKKFDAIDKQFIGIMKATAQERLIVAACTQDDKLGTLSDISDRLDKSQKSLTDYLDTKRNAFARFFFISADELLSILGSSDPTNIQAHMLKLFDNVKFLGFGRGNRTITGQESSEREKYAYVTPTPIEGPVEVWMTNVEDEMHASLLKITKAGVYAYGHENRTEWLKGQIGMVALVSSQIFWTYGVEDAFRSVKNGKKYAIKELATKLSAELTTMVAMVRTDLDKNTRSKVNTMLILDVHGRDIVDSFVRESVMNAKEFAWESQLRFYWDKDVDNCIIRQCTGSFQYGYEYMGLNGRLVITELTDRCYMTLTQALTFKLGGAPAGPAGTGKTETTKDLAKGLALPCFVINCGDGLDYKAMASIFAGLVQVGAWGCFDEFNRINIEVLSVVSAQLKAIQNGIVYMDEYADIGMANPIRIKRVAGFSTCGFFSKFVVFL